MRCGQFLLIPSAANNREGRSLASRSELSTFLEGVEKRAFKQAVFAVRDEESGEARANLIVVTHMAPDAALSATVDALANLPTVDEVTSVMRVEGS